MRTTIAFALAVVLGAVIAREQAPAAAAPLRICADPDDMPFSNRTGQGFENKIAAVLGRELHRRVQYTWWPQRRNYVRNTLDAGRCDAILGVPAGASGALSTAPYYASTYVFAYRADRNLDINSFDDPKLRKLRIGVHMTDTDYTPPGAALGRRGLGPNIVSFRLYGDENESSKIMSAIVSGDIDIAVVWGPVAGYYARRSATPLVIRPVSPARDGVVPFTFSIAATVRKSDTALRQELDAALRRNKGEINSILLSYGLPLASLNGGD